MPKIIANSIIGVQPMTGPSASVFSLRSRYTYNHKTIKMAFPEYFKNFLRLNNRRRSFTVDEFKNAGYPVVELCHSQWRKYNDIRDWCNSNFQIGTWVSDGYNTFAFSNIDQATFFKLAWDDAEQ